MGPSEFRERRGADNHALAAMGLTACAILAAVLSIPFVLAGVGLVAVAFFFEACSRLGRCGSLADLFGWGAPFGLYRWAAVAVFYLGGAILAFAWVAEGLSVTADRSGDDSSNRFR